MENLSTYIYLTSIIKIVFTYIFPTLFLILSIFAVVYLKKMYDYVRYIARNIHNIVEKSENE